SPPAARAWTANIKVSLNGVGCRTPVPVEQESKIRAPRHDGQGPLGDRHVGTPSTEGWNQHETARVNHTAGYADKCCAASRAIMSVLPPAPNGTTMVTGLEGQSAAAIEPDNRAIAASPPENDEQSQRAMHINSRCLLPRLNVVASPANSKKPRALRIISQGRQIRARTQTKLW